MILKDQHDKEMSMSICQWKCPLIYIYINIYYIYIYIYRYIYLFNGISNAIDCCFTIQWLHNAIPQKMWRNVGTSCRLVSGSWVMVLCCIKLQRLPKCNNHGSQIAIATEIPRMPHPFCGVQEHPNKVCECVSTGRNS